MVANLGTGTGTRQVELCRKHLTHWQKTKESDTKWCAAKDAQIEMQRKLQPLQEAVWTREWELANEWLKSFGL
jgi:hypothetical protein